MTTTCREKKEQAALIGDSELPKTFSSMACESFLRPCKKSGCTSVAFGTCRSRLRPKNRPSRPFDVACQTMTAARIGDSILAYALEQEMQSVLYLFAGGKIAPMWMLALWLPGVGLVIVIRIQF